MFTAVNIYGREYLLPSRSWPHSYPLLHRADQPEKKALIEKKCILMKKKLFYLKKCDILRAQFPFFLSPNTTFSGEMHQMASPCEST